MCVCVLGAPCGELSIKLDCLEVFAGERACGTDEVCNRNGNGVRDVLYNYGVTDDDAFCVSIGLVNRCQPRHCWGSSPC